MARRTRKPFQEVLEFLEDLRSVAQELLYPCFAGCPFHKRLQQKQGAVQPQGLPALVEGSAPAAGLHDHRGVGKERHGSIPLREGLSPRFAARRELRDDQVILRDPFPEASVSGRIGRIHTGSQDGDGPTSRSDRLLVGGSVDPFRQSADDDDVPPGKFPCQPPGACQPFRPRGPGTDDGDPNDMRSQEARIPQAPQAFGSVFQQRLWGRAEVLVAAEDGRLHRAGPA